MRKTITNMWMHVMMQAKMMSIQIDRAEYAHKYYLHLFTLVYKTDCRSDTSIQSNAEYIGIL